MFLYFLLLVAALLRDRKEQHDYLSLCASLWTTPKICRACTRVAGSDLAASSRFPLVTSAMRRGEGKGMEGGREGKRKEGEVEVGGDR